MSRADVMLVGIERVSDPEFLGLQACVERWRRCWGLSLTHCLRLEDGPDAFILVVEQTEHEALNHLEELLRALLPGHVIVPRAYVQGHHYPVYTLDEAGFEQMQRHQQRLDALTQAARAGHGRPLLPAKDDTLTGVAAWRNWNHLRPAGKGLYLICDACGLNTARHASEEAAWQAAQTQGWAVDPERGVCYCAECVANGNATAAEHLHLLESQSQRSA